MFFRLLIVVLCLISSVVYANDAAYLSPMSMYGDNYFISGNNDETQVKFQVSTKYNILYPSKTGVYLGYTQRSKWMLYNPSAPFTETNYMPEVFYRFESGNNLLSNITIPLLDYVQVSPIAHMSNGRDGLYSRSINTYYGQMQLSYGDHYNIGTNVKVFNYYNIAKNNKDINDYKKNYEADIFIKIKSTSVTYLDKEELHFKFGGYGPSDYELYQEGEQMKGWFCVEAHFRLLTSIIQPKFFIQYYKGSGEWMIDYNKSEQSLRIGLVF